MNVSHSAMSPDAILRNGDENAHSSAAGLPLSTYKFQTSPHLSLFASLTENGQKSAGFIFFLRSQIMLEERRSVRR